MTDFSTITDAEMIEELNRRGTHLVVLLTARDVLRACEGSDIEMTEEAARYGAQWVWKEYDTDPYKDIMTDWAIDAAQNYLRGER